MCVMAKNIFLRFLIYMMRISKAEFKILNNDFMRFQTRITQSKKQDNTYFVSQMNHFEKRYKKAGLENQFAISIFTFAEKMDKLGINDLPGIIYSSLMKMPFIKSEVKELYALKGLEYAQNQGDSIHTLARLVDLEKIYKKNGNTHKYTRILFQEEKVLVNICSNFKNAKESYKTYSREHSRLKKYETELAKTRVDIAKVILNTNPKQAKILLTKARKFFCSEKRNKEVDFVDLMLSELETKMT